MTPLYGCQNVKFMVADETPAATPESRSVLLLLLGQIMKVSRQISRDHRLWLLAYLFIYLFTDWLTANLIPFCLSC